MIVRLLGLAAFFQATPAFAHPPPLGLTGFGGGLLHPAFVPSHLLAIVGLALLIGRQAEWRWAFSLCFAAGLAAGLMVLTFGVAPQFTLEAVMVVTTGVAALVAWARPLSATPVGALTAAAGFCVAFDSPPETVSVSEANRMLVGTGLGALVLLAVAAWIVRRLQGRWAEIAVRVAGSWIAASAILFLAFKLAR